MTVFIPNILFFDAKIGIIKILKIKRTHQMIQEKALQAQIVQEQ